MEAYRWRQLREAADVIARVPRAAVELWRPQAAFNHALLDVLEQWPPEDAVLQRACDELERLAVAPASGLSGRAWELALGRWVRLQRAQNLARVAALRRGKASTASVRFQRFDLLLDAVLPAILQG